MKAKELLKKIFYGKLIPLNDEIDEGMCEYNPPERISTDTPNFEHKVIYAVAHLQDLYKQSPISYQFYYVGKKGAGVRSKALPLIIVITR